MSVALPAGHGKVTAERIIESWAESTVAAVEGRHVLAIQDTSEIHFNTTPQRRRGLGEIGKGNNYGVLLHPLLAVDAEEAQTDLIADVLHRYGGYKLEFRPKEI